MPCLRAYALSGSRGLQLKSFPPPPPWYAMEYIITDYISSGFCLPDSQDDCICVPHSATVRAQVISSELVWRWHKLQPIRIPGGDDIIPPAEMSSCSGAASVHDVQLSQLSPDQFQPITEPLAMMDFNFTKGDFSENRTSAVGCKSLASGDCQGKFAC